MSFVSKTRYFNDSESPDQIALGLFELLEGQTTNPYNTRLGFLKTVIMMHKWVQTPFNYCPPVPTI